MISACWMEIPSTLLEIAVLNIFDSSELCESANLINPVWENSVRLPGRIIKGTLVILITVTVHRLLNVVVVDSLSVLP